VTSDGKVKPCLMRKNNLTDLLTPLRNGADDKKLKTLFLEAVKKREPYYKPVLPSQATM
jgi:cyclic pyranopterin phosphate synthase